MASAVDACQSKGLSLARITTGCEFDSMLAYIESQGLSGKEFWIDAKTGDNGFLEANDGTLLPYNNFDCGQPDGSGPCVQLCLGYPDSPRWGLFYETTQSRWQSPWQRESGAARGLLMDDTPCSYGKNAICEAFTIIPGGFNMASAVDACQSKGLSLARITTGCEFDSMLAYIDSQGLSGKEFWIDAKTGDNGFLEANDGTLLPYNNFDCGQPDGSGPCVQLCLGYPDSPRWGLFYETTQSRWQSPRQRESG
ncbi:uncharacterized protein LOC144439863 [Glandiceps talaboti]